MPYSRTWLLLISISTMRVHHGDFHKRSHNGAGCEEIYVLQNISAFGCHQWVKEEGAERFAWTSMQSKINWKHNKEDFQTLVQAAQYDWGAGWNWRKRASIPSVPLLQKIHTHTKINVPLAMTVLPVAYQVYAEQIHDQPQELLKALAKEENIPVLDFCLLCGNTKTCACTTTSVIPTHKEMNSWRKALNPFVEKLLQE